MVKRGTYFIFEFHINLVFIRLFQSQENKLKIIIILKVIINQIVAPKSQTFRTLHIIIIYTYIIQCVSERVKRSRE